MATQGVSESAHDLASTPASPTAGIAVSEQLGKYTCLEFAGTTTAILEPSHLALSTLGLTSAKLCTGRPRPFLEKEGAGPWPVSGGEIHLLRSSFLDRQGYMEANQVATPFPVSSLVCSVPLPEIQPEHLG